MNDYDCELSDGDLERIAAGKGGKAGGGRSTAASWGTPATSAGTRQSSRPRQAPPMSSGGGCANGQCSP